DRACPLNARASPLGESASRKSARSGDTYTPRPGARPSTSTNTPSGPRTSRRSDALSCRSLEATHRRWGCRAIIMLPSRVGLRRLLSRAEQIRRLITILGSCVLARRRQLVARLFLLQIDLRRVPELIDLLC